MSLSAKTIDRLFERLAAVYGAQWLRQWEGVPMSDVKTAWGHELAVYAGRLDVLAWVLDNLPERVPNAIGFKALCRGFPAPVVPALPMPAANPERMREELAKLGHVSGAVPQQTTGGKDWAVALIDRWKSGGPVGRIGVRFAHEALGLPVPAGCR